MNTRSLARKRQWLGTKTTYGKTSTAGSCDSASEAVGVSGSRVTLPGELDVQQIVQQIVRQIVRKFPNFAEPGGFYKFV